MGALEVVHTPEEAQFDDRHGGGFHSDDNRPLDNAACNGAAAG